MAHERKQSKAELVAELERIRQKRSAAGKAANLARNEQLTAEQRSAIARKAAAARYAKPLPPAGDSA